MASQQFLYPDLIPSESGFNIVSPTEMDISTLTGVEYISENSGERWHIELVYKFLRRHEAIQLKAHLLQLRGSTNISLIKDHSFAQRGTWNGTPRIRGVNEYGIEIDVDGLLSNQVTMATGDRFKLGNRIHEVVEDANAGAGSQAIVKLANEVIDIPADNTVLISDPEQLTIGCRWVRPDEIKQFNGNRSYYRNIRLTFVEALAP